MKVRLLTDGGFSGMGNFDYNAAVEVAATNENGTLARIKQSELVAHGAFLEMYGPAYLWNFLLGTECEIVEE